MKDLFSGHATQYAAFRPSYPPALYDAIMSQTRNRYLAWDCACGNGQVAIDLSRYFARVEATDISQQQLNNAVKADNINYSLCPAERTPFSDNSFDLITVGQALHWFRIPEFFEEVKRVGKPGSVIAVWGYGLFRISSGIDAVMDDFYVNVVGPYWDPERKLIDEQYRNIDFPFEPVPVPDFEFSFTWTLDQTRGYLSTWSSVQKFIKQNGTDPVEELVVKLAPLWTTRERKVVFPLFVLMGRI